MLPHVDGHSDAPTRASADPVRRSVDMSFPLSFHLALLGPTGAHWLDDPPDLSCKETTRQHTEDGRCCLVHNRFDPGLLG